MAQKQDQGAKVSPISMRRFVLWRCTASVKEPRSTREPSHLGCVPGTAWAPRPLWASSNTASKIEDFPAEF